jgi:AhpD family alkylhydroperoxidase
VTRLPNVRLIISWLLSGMRIVNLLHSQYQMTMTTFPIPIREQVSPANQILFDNLTKFAGHVPNLYAIFAWSEDALGNYLTLQSGQSSLKVKEREVINLVVSQVNGCEYCLSAHTYIAKKLGFTDEQILAIRQASILFDKRLDALAKLVKSIVENKGHSRYMLDLFFAAGYTRGSLVDAVIAIGDKVITNYLYALTDVPIDYPIVPSGINQKGDSSFC